MEARAGARCEYCRAPQVGCGYRFHLEHIVPTSLQGADDPANRALACMACNLAKGDRTAGRDPVTRRVLPLFNPRTQVWDDHFRWSDDCCEIIGRTAIGRATISALKLNKELLRNARRCWKIAGTFP